MNVAQTQFNTNQNGKIQELVELFQSFLTEFRNQAPFQQTLSNTATKLYKIEDEKLVVTSTELNVNFDALKAILEIVTKQNLLSQSDFLTLAGTDLNTFKAIEKCAAQGTASAAVTALEFYPRSAGKITFEEIQEDLDVASKITSTKPLDLIEFCIAKNSKENGEDETLKLERIKTVSKTYMRLSHDI